MKIMIAGNKGQLGSDSEIVLGTDHELLAIDLDELDITNLSDVQNVVQDFSPHVILNCAAYTLVDKCETEKELAWNVNVIGPKNLALSVGKYGGRLIHTSTDYVFDGRKKIPQPYAEADAPNPINYYGITKNEGEKAVRNALHEYVIVRTSWLYGFKGHNFLKTMLKLALKNPDKEIRVVDDQYGSPTWSYRLAQQISRLVDTDGRGTFHATSEGHCTWYELAECFLEKMDVPHILVPCTSEEYPTPAARPKNSILENRHLKNKKMNIMRHWIDDLDRFVSKFRERLIGEALSDV
ncbi:MAG: dTDP-4-dehydrorhamnose reductase [Deltaproteobacteria bacterium]|nr:dTDP-4-dehydrorhamnose reductase [Deltaproteobacteria bacterium]